MARPTKLTQKVIDTLNKVVDNNIYCTDYELVFLLNEQLPEKEKISYESFKDYKNGRSQANNPLIVSFSHVIKKALIKEKIALLKEIKDGVNNWQSRAWILERKFDEWNLKKITENTNKNEVTISEQLNEIKLLSFIDNTVPEDEINDNE